MFLFSLMLENILCFTLIYIFIFFFSRQHTIAFVPSSGVLYAFGCGEHGQLGTGFTSNVICPTAVKGRWSPHNVQMPPLDG